MHFRSKTGVSAPSAAARLDAPADSPVSADSSARSRSQVRMRQSAGTISPSSRVMTSPGTSCSLPSSRSLPPRMVLTRQTESFFSFSMALSARYCCKKPTKVFSKMIRSRMPVSASSCTSSVIYAMTAETAAAHSSRMVMKSLNCAKKRRSAPPFFLEGRTFAPFCAKRRAASSSVSP